MFAVTSKETLVSVVIDENSGIVNTTLFVVVLVTVAEIAFTRTVVEPLTKPDPPMVKEAPGMFLGNPPEGEVTEEMVGAAVEVVVVVVEPVPDPVVVVVVVAAGLKLAVSMLEISSD